MKKILFIIVLTFICFALFAKKSDVEPTSYTGYGKGTNPSENVSAASKIVFIYDKEYARAGFTLNKVDSTKAEVQTDLTEVELKTDYDTRKAVSNPSSTDSNFYAYWQINNSKGYTITISSDGLKKADGSAVSLPSGCSWNVSADSSSLISNTATSAVLYEKASGSADTGSKALVVTIEDYPLLAKGSYVLPLTLELKAK